MKLNCQTPKRALKPFLRQKPLRSEIDLFKSNLIGLLDKISVIEKLPYDETEEHLKNNIRDFLRDTWYKDSNAINTKDKKDLVIHLGKTTDSEAGVIIEAKRPTNVPEMISADHPNRKALHELILYYLDERNKTGNSELKQLVVTNIYEWYIIDANCFDKHIFRNTQIQKLYKTKQNDHKDNPFFYEEIAKIVQNLDLEIPCVHFDIRDYEKILRNDRKDDDRELIALFKILSPQHLLKIAAPNDSNSLDDKFYKELLHIIGLEEVKEGSKSIIRRKKENRNRASFIELTIDAIHTEDTLHRLPDQSVYGETREERIFNIALELCITWINRILFLKLLEGQLVTYHRGEKEWRFLNTEMIHDFDELFKLFHKVLAVNLNDRSEAIKAKYSRVPYLNSSLFEISELEDQIIKINSLENDAQLELIGTTVLKDVKKHTGSLATYDYLFKFLDAYDFSGEGTEDIQEDGKTIINASVLGKVFEKINGYKDGSIFTPGFITMYMCRQSIRLAVAEKFNEYGLANNLPDVKPSSFEEIYDLIPKQITKPKANEIINSLKICDPAVGSGHFLVSALNEIIAVKSELGILMDENGKTLRDYEIEIVNDELIVTDDNGDPFTYNYKSAESNRVQKTLFREKQTIIENCLFGVDINPNSVKICRLRLWIELLKNAYYRIPETGDTTPELETLPNIDINIKCGNSLLSRFALDADLGKALKTIKYDIKAYRGFVDEYKNEKNREVKRVLHKIIDDIKSNFRTHIDDPFKSKIAKARGELQNTVDEINRKKQWGEKVPAELKAKLEKVTKRFNQLDAEREAAINNVIYKNAFEWRFEFPEVLNNEGEFEGFDVVIGNPPYVQLQIDGGRLAKIYENQNYKTFERTGDIYSLFYEQGLKVLKSKGLLCFITSNKWMRAGYGASTREFIGNQTNPILLIDFAGLKIFESATVDTNMLMVEKKQNTYQTKACIVKDKITNLNDYVEQNGTECSFKGIDSWNIHNTIEQRIKNKIELHGTPLKDWDINIYRGILTGYNDAFIIDGKKKDELIALDPKSAEIIRPILRGRDIKRYGYEFADLWLINTHNGIKEKGIKPILIDDYPIIKKHLDNYFNELSKRSDKGDTPYNLRNCAYLEDFFRPKIVWAETMRIHRQSEMRFPRFGLDLSNDFVTDKTCFFAIGDNLKIILSILNSRLGKYMCSQYVSILDNGGYLMQKLYLENLPIAHPSKDCSKLLEIKVDDVLNSNSTLLEKEIDEIVYDLYKFNKDEISYIDSQ